MVAAPRDDGGLVDHADGARRCWWCGTDPDYVAYHDNEWGHWPDDDQSLFEKLCLEGFQAGLSWLTVLRRRDILRGHLLDFSPHTLAALDEPAWQATRTRALDDVRMIRHAGKIDAVRHNAAVYQEIVNTTGAFTRFVSQWRPQSHRRPRNRAEVAVSTPQSHALARALKQQGWRFIGPTSAYAFMQAMGLVNDHIVGCDYAADAATTTEPSAIVSPS